MDGPNYGLIDNALVNKNRAVEGYGAVNTLISQNLQNQADKMAIENALAEKAAYSQAGGDVTKAQENLMKIGQGKQSVALGKAVAETEQAKMKAMTERLPVVREMAKDMAFNPSDQNIQAHLQDQILKGWISPDEAKQRWTAVAGMNPEQRRDHFLQGATKAEDTLKLMEDKRHNKVSESISQQNANIAGGNLSVAQQRLAADLNPEFQARLAGAKETGKVQGQAAIALPAALSTAKEGIRKVDDLLKAPGFSDAVGATWKPGARFVPGTDAADFMARLDEIKGGAFMQAFNTLKGGGAISEKEGEKATAAVTRMSTAQSEKEFKLAAEEFKGVLKQGIINAEAKAGKAGKSAATGGGTIDFNDLK